MPRSICRICTNYCSIDVETIDGRIRRIRGDSGNPIYAGYVCAKGARQGRNYQDPARLLHSVKRTGDGTYTRIPVQDAIGEIAERLRLLLDRFGPRTLAMYSGTYFGNEFPGNSPVGSAFMRAVGSPLNNFTAYTIDQPGKIVVKGLHGVWMAPDRSLLSPEVAMMFGTNPMVSHQGRLGPPKQLLKDFEQWGTKLIVVDPRRTETARRAHLHLQPRPGEDPAIIGALLHVIFAEGLQDAEFLAEHVQGVDALRRRVASINPGIAAERAGVPADDIVQAARMFGNARHAYANGGTGPNMAGYSTLFEYLLMSLNTVCGQWSRAGDVVTYPTSLLPVDNPEPKAQALPPYPAVEVGASTYARRLPIGIAGPPAAALPEEILEGGPGRIRALLCPSGSPAVALPDQLRAVEALKALDLFVQADVHMSPSARLAEYVIACRLPLEMPSTTYLGDGWGQEAVGWGYRRAYAQYTPAIVEPPEGSEVIPQWELFYGLARELGLTLEISPGGDPRSGVGKPVALDMTETPTSEHILDLLHVGSRVPLDTVRSAAGGRIYEDPPAIVAGADHGWKGRLDVGNSDMMMQLTAALSREAVADDAYPFRLLCRRSVHVMNTPGLGYPANRPRHNPLGMHPDDLVKLGLEADDIVELRSARAVVDAVVEESQTASTWHGCGSTMRSSVGDLLEAIRDLRTAICATPPTRRVR